VNASAAQAASGKIGEYHGSFIESVLPTFGASRQLAELPSQSLDAICQLAQDVNLAGETEAPDGYTITYKSSADYLARQVELWRISTTENVFWTRVLTIARDLRGDECTATVRLYGF
jgi:hypothetical protein